MIWTQHASGIKRQITTTNKIDNSDKTTIIKISNNKKTNDKNWSRKTNNIETVNEKHKPNRNDDNIA